VPPLLLALLKYVFDDQPQTFQRIAPALVGLFPFTVVFLVTSIAMLRERTGGTLERLMSLPLAKLDLLLGYALAFAVVAAIQASVAAGVAFWLLDLTTQGPAWQLIALAVANALLGMALGLCFRAFCDRRVPSGPVHASSRVPPGLAGRPVRPERRHGTRPRVHLQRPSPYVCLRRLGAGNSR
jgi:ABC-type multidrug transport system permease subunit